MGSQISSLGWILIILLILLIVSLYVSLFSKLKDKESKNKTGWITSIKSAGKSLKDPFWYENSKMQELANNVEKIQHKTNTETTQNTGSSDAGDSK